MQPEVAVAFLPREKFSWALASLKRLYALAGTPFRLYVVDTGYPPQVRAGIQEFLADKGDVTWIPTERFLYPSEAFNLAVEIAREPYLFQLQNDILIGRDALRFMLEAARELACDLVAPAIFDTDEGRPSVHRESGHPVIIREENGLLYCRDDPDPKVKLGRRQVYYFEMHCFLISAEAARAVGPLPPLTVHEHIDLSIALWRQGRTSYLEERAGVLYLDSPPVPLRDYDRAFYDFRWDAIRARQSDRYVRDQWRIGELFDGNSFAARQQRALRPEAILASYDSVFSADVWPEDLAGR